MVTFSAGNVAEIVHEMEILGRIHLVTKKYMFRIQNTLVKIAILTTVWNEKYNIPANIDSG